MGYRDRFVAHDGSEGLSPDGWLPDRILMPAFFTHDRPGRASPRKTKKAGDFPARKPGEPSVTKVTRTIEFHLLCPWQLTRKQRHRDMTDGSLPVR
jgi:hypothetical protein